MCKKWFFVFLILALFLSSQACTSIQSAPEEPVNTDVVYTQQPVEKPEIPTYSVTKSTGLYDAFYYANVKADLPKGAKLIPMNGATVLACDSFVVTGITYELCKVEVVNTAVNIGQSGWVLKKWISKD